MALRTRIAISMFSVVAISGAVAAAIGGYLLHRNLDHEAGNRVQQDLHAAQAFYDQRLRDMTYALRYTALGERFSQAVANRDLKYLTTRLRAVRDLAKLDMLCVADPAGRVIHRTHCPEASGDSIAEDPLVATALQGREFVSGTALVPVSLLRRENASLAERAAIPILPTLRAKAATAQELTSGMVLCAVARVRTADGSLAGILRGCLLLNRNHDLVDHVQNTVFRDERYQGKPLGMATLFQHDVRISTNVMRDDGTRAIGTRVSAEIHDHVLRQGKT